MQSIWFLSWTAHAVAHGQALLFSDALHAPDSVNLMWNTPMVLLGVLAAPLTLTAGPVASYNVLMVGAFTASAWCASHAIRRICDDGLASWVGGLLFAFSPYMVAQSMGHLDLVVMVYPPLTLILLDELVIRRQRSRWVTGAALGVATAAQVLVFEEVVVSTAIGVAVAASVSLLCRRSLPAVDWRGALPGLGVAALTAVILAGPAVAFQLTGPQVPAGLHEVGAAPGSDLAHFVVPSTSQALAAGVVPQAPGEDAYLGVPLLLLLVLVVWTFRRLWSVRLPALVGAVYAVLSLGPWLEFAGVRLSLPLPWRLLEHVPLVDNLVPLRLMGLADLCVVALVAVGLASRHELPRTRRRAIEALTVLAVATWFPSLPRPSLTTPLPPTMPVAVTRSIPAHGAVIFAPLPSVRTADAMWYQLEDGFSFRLVGGYAYGVWRSLPLMSALDPPSRPAIEAATREVIRDHNGPRLVSGLRELGVTTVVVPPGPDAAAFTELFTAVFALPPHVADGFATWSLAAASPTCATVRTCP